jgi:hypothetical protein
MGKMLVQSAGRWRNQFRTQNSLSRNFKLRLGASHPRISYADQHQVRVLLLWEIQIQPNERQNLKFESVEHLQYNTECLNLTYLSLIKISFKRKLKVLYYIRFMMRHTPVMGSIRIKLIIEHAPNPNP